MSRVNVIVVVDVIGALSAETPMNGNVFMVDDSAFHSANQGTTQLCTACRPGDLIKWSALAVDVQTPVAIRKISFLGDHGAVAPPPLETSNYSELDLMVWEGIVPPHLVPGTLYRYELELQMYKGVASIMRIDTPGLVCPT